MKSRLEGHSCSPFCLHRSRILLRVRARLSGATSTARLFAGPEILGFRPKTLIADRPEQWQEADPGDPRMSWCRKGRRRQTGAEDKRPEQTERLDARCATPARVSPSCCPHDLAPSPVRVSVLASVFGSPASFLPCSTPFAMPGRALSVHLRAACSPVPTISLLRRAFRAGSLSDHPPRTRWASLAFGALSRARRQWELPCEPPMLELPSLHLGQAKASRFLQGPGKEERPAPLLRQRRQQADPAWWD